MRMTKPEYCASFRCLASACRDNCCIGWQIDIDPITALRYEALDGEIGERIRANTVTDDFTHFLLGADRRCPMLNKRNLCDIICKAGEETLCDICREHPRYYNIVGSIAESGIGLACEAAADLILSAHLPISFTYEEIDVAREDCDRAELALILDAREKIYHAIYENDNILNLLSDLWGYCPLIDDSLFDIQVGIIDSTEAPPIVCGVKNGAPLRQILDKGIEALSSLEALDCSWSNDLNLAKQHLTEKESLSDILRLDGYVKRLLFYFIHRYLLPSVYDGSVGARIRLAVLSSAVIALIAVAGDRKTKDDFVCLAKDFSKNLEYSTENIGRLIDIIDGWE